MIDIIFGRCSFGGCFEERAVNYVYPLIHMYDSLTFG